MNAFILSPHATFRQVTTSSLVDVGLWSVNGKTLILATNMNYAAKTATLNEIGVKTTSTLKQVLDSGASAKGSTLSFESTGTGAWIV